MTAPWVWRCTKCERLVANRNVRTGGDGYYHGWRCGGRLEAVRVV